MRHYRLLATRLWSLFLRAVVECAALHELMAMDAVALARRQIQDEG